MIFNGDLSKYHPADAIMFLSQLNLNGVFSIAGDQCLISLVFNNGAIIDAHSAKGDAKLLQALIFKRLLAGEQVQQLRQIKQETGMPMRAILAKLAFFPLASISDILLVGMQEVLLEMFLLDHGTFHFTDTPVDPDDADTRLDARVIAIRVAAQSDEFRDFAKTVAPLEGALSLTESATSAGLTNEAKVVLRMVPACRTVGQLFERAPFDSHTVMEIITAQLEAGRIRVEPPVRTAEPTDAAGSGVDPVFGAFRQALKKLMLSPAPLKKLEALASYCRGFYEVVVILTSRDGEVVHVQQIIRSNGQGTTQQSRKGRFGRLDQDAGLAAVHRSGVGFFGDRFPSALLDGVIEAPDGGECALIPVVTHGNVAIFIYAHRQEKIDGLSPQHYLEMLSWMATAGHQPGGAPLTDSVVRMARHGGAAAPPDQPSPDKWIAAIDDLPPLPTLVTRALELLNDPGAAVKEVEAVIGQDQSLVSKLIRVSNSALFGGMNRVESLHQALTRLGAKTVKSLILAASMQGYFLKSHPGILTRGQALWQHAAECGMAARRIAMAVGLDDPETAFVGGVVHDIGKLVILLAGDDAHQRIQTLKRREGISEREAEARVIGADHAVLGERLMEKWKMPASVRCCVKYHHCVADAEDNQRLAAIAAYANHLSHLHGAQPQPVSPQEQAMVDDLVGHLGLSAGETASLIETVADDFQDTSLLA